MIFAVSIGPLTAGCFDVIALRPEFRAAAARHDALAIADGLEKLIDSNKDTSNDRAAAYDAVRQWPNRAADYAFARASLAGRLAQVKGLSAIGLVREMERWARYSIKLDASFRKGAAKRMLGTLYVLAPASLLDHGDSEEGLELLEGLLEKHPEDIENHLRVAEGYVSLDDPEPAYPALCKCSAGRARLRPSDQRLLAHLLEQVGGLKALNCK